MKTFLRIILSLGFIVVAFQVSAQKYTLSGHIKDASNGEMLLGVNVYEKNTTNGVVSNAYGFYSLSLSQGKHNIVVSFIGYTVIDTVIKPLFSKHNA
ncbi:MAG: carboxypeptidase-like regulatory domain-containing protein [Bacteroidales bacterium]|nr:carboxypeptidase-like regulatory domain-containing protein [Bacteroidales bacterium]